MIRHIVLLRFKPEITENTIAEFFDDLHKIKQKIPGILDITSGKSQSPEQMERGYMHGFVVDFADWKTLQAYQDHPEHKTLGANLVNAAQNGINGILVVDFETEETFAR